MKIRFGVFLVGKRWSLCRAEVRLQSFASKLDAMAAAGKAMLKAASGGAEVELHVMDTGGMLRQVGPEWPTPSR